MDAVRGQYRIQKRQPRASTVCALLLRARADPALRAADGRTAEDMSRDCRDHGDCVPGAKCKGRCFETRQPPFPSARAYRRAVAEVEDEDAYAKWMAKRALVALCVPTNRAGQASH